ncbi:MAG: hypothetical protein JXB48_13600 [Candidatus Latescibacteria bacterium]|nr:hypothetical protein [Candidatus Latescibacterota bacterium]
MEKPFKKSTFRMSGFVLLLIPSFIAVSLLLLFYGKYYIKSLIPLITYEFEKIYPEGKITKIEFVKMRHRHQIHFTIRTHKNFTDERGISWPVSDLTVGINTFALYIHPLLVLSLLAALPFLSKKEKLIVISMSCPLIIVSVLTDIPFHLLYELKESYIAHAPQVPMQISWSLSFWYHALNTGGRQFLSLIVIATTLLLFFFITSDKKL